MQFLKPNTYLPLQSYFWNTRWFWWIKHPLIHLSDYFSDVNFAMLIHVFLIAKVDYFNALYLGLPLKTTWKLWLEDSIVACFGRKPDHE